MVLVREMPPTARPCRIALSQVRANRQLIDGPSPTENHRTTAVDDMRGVGESLRETMCSCRDCDCPGLIARGTFLLAAGPAGGGEESDGGGRGDGGGGEGAARALRLHQLLLNDPPVVAIARLDGGDDGGSGVGGAGASSGQTRVPSASGAGASTSPPAPSAAAAPPSAAAAAAPPPAAARSRSSHPRAQIRGGRWSGLGDGGAPLPPNLHLVTLMRANESEVGGRAIIRLAHMFQVRLGWGLGWGCGLGKGLGWCCSCCIAHS